MESVAPKWLILSMVAAITVAAVMDIYLKSQKIKHHLSHAHADCGCGGAQTEPV